jgi:5-(carboxyamino)imidazole ribonucleotide synthase
MTNPRNSQYPPLLPQANPPTWLGVMGGGQLGRMFAHAAQTMGYKVAVLEPAADCPAGHVADRLISAGYDDAEALAELGRLCRRHHQSETLRPQHGAGLAQLYRAAAACVSVAQDRIAENALSTAPARLRMPAPHQLPQRRRHAAIADALCRASCDGAHGLRRARSGQQPRRGRRCLLRWVA